MKFDFADLELYNNLMKNIILKKRVAAFREQRIKDEEYQRLNQYKKAKKKVLRYGRAGNAKTFWEPKK